jgi:hypothetical protein
MILKKSIAYFAAFTLAFSMLSCEEDNSSDSQASNYVGLEISKIVEISDGQTVTVEGRILASNATGEDRTFNLVVESTTTHGAGNYSVPTSVTIPSGSKEGTYEVTLIGNNLVDGNKVVVRLEPTEGTNVVNSYTTLTTAGEISGSLVYSNTSFILYRPCASVRARLSIKFDNYPEETAWELYDSSFNLLDSGGFNPAGTAITGYAALGFADRSTFSVVKCLAPGTYTFVIYDDYGDGMYTSSTVSGTYSMNNLNNGLALFSGGGDFGAFSEHEFVIE